MSTYYKTGAAGDSIVFLPSQPTKNRRGARWGYRWRGWCKTDKAHDGAGGLIPASGTGMDSAPTSVTGASAFKLTDVDIEESESPGISIVTLTYEPVGGTSAKYKDGDKEKQADVIDIELSLERDWTGTPIAGEAADALEAGDKTITIGGIRYQYSEFLATFDWTEAALVQAAGVGIGKVAAPTGITSPTSGKWLWRGCSVTETDGLTRKVSTWDYSPVGWPDGGA